jgi:two-component system sensor histidine kinase KdpD
MPLIRRLGVLLGVAAPSLVAATLVVAGLRTAADVPNASIVYLAAVVATAIAAGASGAVVATIGSILLYDWFFTNPYYTLTISEPSEWLNAVLLLGVGLVVGQLAALQRSRAEDARAREREARALFRVGRELATRDSTLAVLPKVGQIVRDEAAMARVWLGVGPEGRERIVADTGGDARPAAPSVLSILDRKPGDEPAVWVRVHAPIRPASTSAQDVYRVRIEGGGTPLGSLWAARDRGSGTPDRTQTRLLAAAADQAGQALAQDRLADEARSAEVVRQSDTLKSALLQSVSHDLRTPLATIRAAAGSLRPDSGLSDLDRSESAAAIDREVEYLNRLVTNLLDLSRIEAGALRADRDVFELDDLVAATIERMGPRFGARLEVHLDAPPVEVDPVFLDNVVTNCLENAVKYAGPDASVRISARRLPDAPFVRLTVEDGGPGVPDDALGRLFEKFYRVPGGPRRSRAGTGIGLAVVEGLVTATGGRCAARRSELGGLAIDIDLRAADIPSGAIAEASAAGAP